MASPSIPAPPHPPPSESSTIRVRTTWPIEPLPPTSERQPIRTARLLIRPYLLSDAEALYEIRRQKEVMQWTAVGVPDRDVEYSREVIARSLPPNDVRMFNYLVIYLGEDGKRDEKDGVVVGHGGCHRFSLENGWPEIGYLFRKEYWGKGLATEFVRGFVEAWWALPRCETELEVDRASAEGLFGDLSGDSVKRVPECLYAVVELKNPGSSRVLEKVGFKRCKEWTVADTRLGFEGNDCPLLGFLLKKPSS